MYFQDEPKTWERFCSEVFNEKFAIAAYLDKIIDAVRELQADGATTVPLTTAEKAIGLASVAVAPGPDGRPKKLTQRVRLSTGSNDRRVAQIAKRRPDILEDMKAGKYPSVRQAAIAAGIVRVPTPLEVALKAYNKLSDSDKAQFHRQIGAPI